MTLPANSVASGDAQPKAKIFISYSRKDLAFVDRLDAALRARGFEPLIDRSEIYAFEDWWKRIEALIVEADTIVFVLSPDAVTSDICTKEVEFAASLNKRFAPIIARRVDDQTMPAELRRLNFIFCDDEAQFEDSMGRLAQALETDIVWVRKHTEFGEQARRWVAANRPGGLLLHSPLLEEAEYWIAYRPNGAPSPSPETQTFIAASRNAEIVLKRRKQFVQVAIYFLLVCIIAGLVAWINQSYIKAQWRWYTVTFPYMISQIRPFVLSTAAEGKLKPEDYFRECAADCPEMIVVPAGSFMMGSPQGIGSDNEHPQHLVTIAKPFAVAKFALTFAEWDACVAYGDCNQDISDSDFGRGRQPVVNVTWDDAQRYVAWLSRMTGKAYRLLSEAEYEYAARAGTQTIYPWGNDIGKGNANCNGCGSKWDNRRPAPVDSFAPNHFGLYQMIGNVWAWVEDCLHDNYDGGPMDGSAWTKGGNCTNHVVRGGAWDRGPDTLRSAFRGLRGSTAVRFNNRGFRVARTLVP